MLWGRKPHHYPQAEVYRNLREQVFALVPEQLGLTPDKLPAGLWGFVLDLGHPGGVASLTALCEGTISLYTSTGGGSIGYGLHEKPRQAAILLLQRAPRFATHCEPEAEHALPQRGNARFHLLMFEGRVAAEVRLTELDKRRHPLTELYLLAQNLIAQVRVTEEELIAQGKLPRP
jgi:hypothetical protein